jgi:tetratricopeptide (TPR) repeat protein
MLAAAMLHADAVALWLPRDSGRADPHIAAAERLLSVFRTDDKPRENAYVTWPIGRRPQAGVTITGVTGQERLFAQRWYALVARLMASYARYDRTERLTKDAEDRFGNAPDLYLAHGLVAELPILRAVPNIRDGIRRPERTVDDTRMMIVDGRVRTDANLIVVVDTRLRTRAIEEYRRALAMDPTHVGTRLRLAWAYTIAEDERANGAVADLLAGSLSGDSRYLATLLRGSLALRRNDSAAALAAYEDAFRVAPSYQTGCVAYSHALKMNGELTRALSIADTCFALAAGGAVEDPWWAFRAGLLDGDTVQWLQEAAWGE